MLIITRKIGDKFFIGDDIEIFVCRFKGAQVWLGVDAPKEVKVLKAERLDLHDIERRRLPANGND
jgi:carbon storage regulator